MLHREILEEFMNCWSYWNWKNSYAKHICR